MACDYAGGRWSRSALRCAAPRTHLAWYLDDPTQYFDLEDGFAFEQARLVLELLAAGRIDGLDRDRQRWLSDVEHVAGLSSSEAGIRIRLGRDLRCGCVFALTVAVVRDTSGGVRLRVVEPPERMCV